MKWRSAAFGSVCVALVCAYQIFLMWTLGCFHSISMEEEKYTYTQAQINEKEIFFLFSDFLNCVEF